MSFLLTIKINVLKSLLTPLRVFPIFSCNVNNFQSSMFLKTIIRGKGALHSSEFILCKLFSHNSISVSILPL